MFNRLLKLAVSTARDVGGLLLNEFTSGPVGKGRVAPIDTAIERLICDKLLSKTPHFGFLGEETGAVAGDGIHTWVVDPQDGTSYYLRGARGPAVSIALLRHRIPVLGVVFAYAAPDHNGDLIAWAEGRPITRNNRVVRQPALTPYLENDHIVLTSPAANIAPQAAADVVSPARYVVLPSIAYRLALVAVGDANATLSVAPLNSWDIAAGHALLRAVGATLLDQNGEEVTYDVDGRRKLTACFGGSETTAAALSTRRIQGRTLREKSAPYVELRPGITITDSGVLSRAQGCMMGHLCADAILADKATPEPHHVQGNPAQPLPGQLRVHSELGLTLARVLVDYENYHRPRVREMYKGWLRSSPIRRPESLVGALTRQHVVSPPNHPTQRRYSDPILRCAPLGVFGALLASEHIQQLAQLDASLTNTLSEVQDVSAAFVATLAFVIRTGEQPGTILEFAQDQLNDKRLGMQPSRGGHDQTAAYHAFNEALHQLRNTSSLRDASMQAHENRKKTGAEPIVTATLFGATYGRDAVPKTWQRLVLSCRPQRGATYPRPARYWAVDTLALTERLLLAGKNARLTVTDAETKDAINRIAENE